MNIPDLNDRNTQFSFGGTWAVHADDSREVYVASSNPYSKDWSDIDNAGAWTHIGELTYDRYDGHTIGTHLCVISFVPDTRYAGLWLTDTSNVLYPLGYDEEAMMEMLRRIARDWANNQDVIQ